MDRCEQDIYDNGKSIVLISGPRSHTIEDWVQSVAKDSGQRVDWHQYGGRAHVIYLGDRNLVQDSIDKLWQGLVDAYMTCTDNFASKADRGDVQRRTLTDSGSM